MKKRIITAGLLFSITMSLFAQVNIFRSGNHLSLPMKAYVPNGNYLAPVNYLKAYVGKSVAEFLRDLDMPVGSFVLNPNYNYPDYSNEFRFANKDVNAVSAIIRDNQKLDNDELYLFYVKFKPQIKYPTAGFMRENREKPLTPAQYAEFEQYTITDIEFSVFPR